MNFLVTFFIFSTIFIAESWSQELKCGDKGCYEAIKIFAELLEKKINESFALLEAAEKELDNITYGNDENFKAKIAQVDEKLANLLKEITIGVDGGDKSLIDLINSLFDDVREIEYLVEESENLAENSASNAGSTATNTKSIQEIIREIQDEMNRLRNATSSEGPEALQNAFDRSEKHDSNTKQLREILNQLKDIIVDYEVNLLNAKMLTETAMERFAETDKAINETLKVRKEVDDKLKENVDLKLTADELENMKKVVKKASQQVNAAYEEAFDLLNDVTKFEFKTRIDEINEKIKDLNDANEANEKNLEDLSNKIAKLLDDMKAAVDAAKKTQENAIRIESNVKKSIDDINKIHEQAKKAISDEANLIKEAQKIHSSLEDFNHNSHTLSEQAEIAMKTKGEIRKKLKDSEKIIVQLEDSLEEKAKAAIKANEKCSTAKEQMLEILKETEEIKDKIKKLETDFNESPDHYEASREANKISDKIDELEKIAAGDGELIDSTQEKAENSKIKVKETDEKVDEALKALLTVIDDIENAKDLDEADIEKFERKLKKAEKDLEESGLDDKLLKVRADQHAQTMLLETYSLEIAALEYQISVLKGNAESLEMRCFKRTRLEP